MYVSTSLTIELYMAKHHTAHATLYASVLVYQLKIHTYMYNRSNQTLLFINIYLMWPLTGESVVLLRLNVQFNVLSISESSHQPQHHCQSHTPPPLPTNHYSGSTVTEKSASLRSRHHHSSPSTSHKRFQNYSQELFQHKRPQSVFVTSREWRNLRHIPGDY